MLETQISTAETKIKPWFWNVWPLSYQRYRTNVTFQLGTIIEKMKYRYILHTSRDKRLVALCHHQSNKVQRAERGPICLASRIKCHISYTTDTFKIGFPSDKNKRIKFLCVCIQFYQPKKEGGGEAGGKRTIAQTLWKTVHRARLQRTTTKGNRNFPFVWDT